MPRQKRSSHKTPLATFLQRILREQNISMLEAARIAGCAPSVLHGWIQGSYPSETIDKLKKLCNHFGYSLAVALSGEPDKIANTFNINEYYAQTTIFEGLAQIQIKKLEPLRNGGANER